MVAGIAAELMLVDPSLQQPANLSKVLEMIEATADGLGAVAQTGHGRVNFWKAVLAAANNGLPTEGHNPARDDPTRDSFFQRLTLRNEPATRWYGFEVRTATANLELHWESAAGRFDRVGDDVVRGPAENVTGRNVDAYMKHAAIPRRRRRHPAVRAVQRGRAAGGRNAPALPHSFQHRPGAATHPRFSGRRPPGR